MNRTSIRSLIELPSWIYQRHQRFWDRAVLAAGWALLYTLCDASIGAFPSQWRVVLAAFIFVGGLCRPVVAYVAFVAAVAYPLYLVSIYVMALALAALVLSALAIAVYAERGALSLALWILCAPLLAPVNLTPLLPLLAGLWWGGLGGAIGGGLAALWLKVCAGMSGYSPGLWPINGWTMTLDPLYERFHAANSLQTLVRLAGPLGAGTGTVALFNLLQVFAWAAAGYVVGSMLDTLHARRAGRASGWLVARSGASTLAALSLGPGLLLVWVGYVVLPSWLQIEGPRWFDPLWLPAQVVWAGFVAWCLDGILRYLQQPVTPDHWFARSSVGWEGDRWSYEDPVRKRKRSAPVFSFLGRTVFAPGKETSAPSASQSPLPSSPPRVRRRTQQVWKRAQHVHDSSRRSKSVYRGEDQEPRDPLELLERVDGWKSRRSAPDVSPAEGGSASDIMIELD